MGPIGARELFVLAVIASKACRDLRRSPRARHDHDDEEAGRVYGAGEPGLRRCGPSGPEVIHTSSPNISGWKHADGTYDLIVAIDAQQALEAGTLPPSWWKLGKVTQRRVDQAAAKTTKVATFSLEDPANNDLVIEFSGVDGKLPTTLKAGDPCISGVVQVAIDPTSGSPIPLFDVYQWVRYPYGPTAKNTYTTGVWPDEPWPVVKYSGSSPSPSCR